MALGLGFFFSCGKLIALLIWCDTCLQLRAVSHAPQNLFFCLHSVRCRLRWEGLIYHSQALQHHSPFLLLSLDEMYDSQQDHLGLQRRTLLTDQFQQKDKLAGTARRFRAAQEDWYLLRQDKSRANVIISSKLHPRASKTQEALLHWRLFKETVRNQGWMENGFKLFQNATELLKCDWRKALFLLMPKTFFSHLKRCWSVFFPVSLPGIIESWMIF